MDWECVIGLEVHVQLLTRTKMFCTCRNAFTHEPNGQVCEICLGHPGTLPVINREAVALGMKAALALNCEIPELTKFDRKHYYYPDLPKNFQISQCDLPLSVGGWLEIDTPAGPRRSGITRAHLEEDAGKLVHGERDTAVDLNRTGTPLLEIVSEPDIHTPAEAKAYLEQLKLTLQYVGASDCNMEEGSLRCDANISIRRPGETALGVKNEIKNMNSFRGVEAALGLVRDELVRQAEAGEEIKQVTWGYRIEDNRIFQMRVKEYANDYRYFPEPDLPPLTVSRAQVDEVRATLPELPRAKAQRFVGAYGLSDYDAQVLVQEPHWADYFETVAAASDAPKEAANWIANDVMRELKERKLTPAAWPVEAPKLAELIGLVNGKTLNMPTARKIFTAMVEGDTRSPARIVEVDGLGQVSDAAPIEKALENAVAANPKAVAELESGKHSTAMWFFGQIMRELKGQGNPETVGAVIAERFGIDPGMFKKKKKK